MLAAATVLGTLALLLPAGASAQSVDCSRLQSQIAAMDQADARTNPYASAVQKQRAEIERSRSYAQSIGCDRQQFLFFGNAPPAQCGGLNVRIQQMRGNLAQLEASAGRFANNPQRQDLVMRYKAYCRPDQPRPRNFLESLFGGGQSEPPPPGDVPPDQLPNADQDQKAHGGSEAVCVRSCDGSFFPLNYSARRSSSETLTEQCKSLCPNAEANVYTLVPGQQIQTAVSLDGTPYYDLPAALKYQKALDPNCSCRAPGQSWADALAGAERVLGHERKGDIIVTPEKSAEMARPKPDAAPRTKVSPGAKGSEAKTAAEKAAQQDDIESRDAAASAQVPTASKDSAGIGPGDVKNSTSYPEGQGQTVETTGPDGVKRRVRIVGPQL